jgi:hypothetical protein
LFVVDPHFPGGDIESWLSAELSMTSRSAERFRFIFLRRHRRGRADNRIHARDCPLDG